jgi:hypothetical protein
LFLFVVFGGWPQTKPRIKESRLVRPRMPAPACGPQATPPGHCRARRTPDSSIMMPSDAFRTGAHVTLAPVRIRHLETNEHRHEQSPAAVRMPPDSEPGRSSQFYCPREPAGRLTKRQHAPRAALRRADSDRRPGACHSQCHVVWTLPP